jgi:hypothetical protein
MADPGVEWPWGGYWVRMALLCPLGFVMRLLNTCSIRVMEGLRMRSLLCTNERSAAVQKTSLLVVYYE